MILQRYADSSSSFDTSAETAARFLKGLAHEGRLKILCHLVHGEKTVSELETLLDARQAAVSQMLARLRGDGLVKTRRCGKMVYYSIKDSTIAQIIGVLYRRFSPEATSKTAL